jgi:hypothetical protein
MRRDRERGAVAILVAGSLILLMGIAAMAVDFGAGVNDRRQNQTAADTSAVAGALSMFNSQDLVNQALGRARSNLRVQYTDTEWRTLWQSCTDPARPANFVPVSAPSAWGGTLDCISRNSAFLRVTLPTQIYDTAFGGVVGMTELRTGATAVATIMSEKGTGLLPFAVRGNVSTGEVCLDSGTGGSSVPPCDGSEAGSFGNIAPPLFGDPFIGSPQRCSNQTSANNNVAVAIAMGMDHIIYHFPETHWNTSTWLRTDNTSNNVVRSNPNTFIDECIEVPGADMALPVDGVGNPINTVWVDTGNNTKADVTKGLVSTSTFFDGKGARLWRVPNDPNWPTDRVYSAGEIWVLDDRPLWDFLVPNANAPASCAPGAVSDTADMLKCLFDYQAAVSNPTHPGVIFSDDLLLSPRFGVAPQLWHTNLGSGQSLRPVETFRPVFINRILFKGKNSNLVEWYPDGVDEPVCEVFKDECNPLTVDQVTAFVLPKGSVSAVVEAHYPGGDPNDLQVSIYQ